ncbi:hypothetical protein D3C76_1778360 [compost metagenome]
MVGQLLRLAPVRQAAVQLAVPFMNVIETAAGEPYFTAGLILQHLQLQRAGVYPA